MVNVKSLDHAHCAVVFNDIGGSFGDTVAEDATNGIFKLTIRSMVEGADAYNFGGFRSGFDNGDSAVKAIGDELVVTREHWGEFGSRKGHVRDSEECSEEKSNCISTESGGV